MLNIVSLGRGAARRATLAGLSLALAFGGVASPALAATAGRTGTVTITQQSNLNATYDGYRIVKADVGADDKGARFEWDSDAMKTTVLAFLDQAIANTGASKSYAAWLTENGHTAVVNGVSAHDLPQNAIEYIAAMVDASNEAQGTDTTPETKQQNSFADNLAQALKNASPSLGISGIASTGVAFEGPQGYYLFTTTGATLSTDEVGTAPIFVALGATPKNVTEKSAIPTIDKQVKEDKSGEWGKVADGNKDQELDFRLRATMPTNYDAFDSYHMRFNDTLPAGMSLKGNNTSSVKVRVFSGPADTTGTDVTSQITGARGAINYKNDKLTVDMTNLRTLDLATNTLTKDSIVQVEYQAHLDADCVIGKNGNDNTVTLTYTNDPISRSDGETSPKQNKVATYQLGIEKVDHDNHKEALEGAKFTIRVSNAGASDTASVGKYLQADGSLGATAYEFVTNAQGKIVVPRIDEGTYVVHETAAPTGYEAIDEDVTVTVTATKDQTAGTVTALAMTVSGGNGPDGMATPAQGATSVADHQDGVLEANVDTGSLRFRVSDDKLIYLPGTGLTPNQAGTIVGITMVVASVGVIFLRQRRVRGNVA